MPGKKEKKLFWKKSSHLIFIDFQIQYPVQKQKISKQKKTLDNINENCKEQCKGDINAEGLQVVKLPEIFLKVTLFVCSRGKKDQKFKNFKKKLESMNDDEKIFEKEANRNSRTEKYKAKIMSLKNGYKSSLDTAEESISEVEDKPEENIQNEEQRVK